MFQVNSKEPRATLLTKTNLIVANLHGQAMETNGKPLKWKVQNLKQNFWKHFWSWWSLDWHKDIGVGYQLTETSIFIAIHTEKHVYQLILIQQSILPKGIFW